MFAMNPWSLVVRGIVAIVFGLLLVLWPGITLETLVLVFAFFALLDGIIIIIMAMIEGRKNHAWINRVPLGIVGIVLGALIMLWPGISLIILIYLVAAWALIAGFGEFTYALAIKGLSSGAKWMMAIAGVLTIIIGILIFIYPISTAAILIWILGLYLMIYGIFVMITGFWLRGLNKKIGSGPDEPAAA